MKDTQPGHIRAAALILLACLLPALPACSVRTGQQYVGIDEQENPDVLKNRTAAQAARELVPQELVRVGVVQAGHESDWRIAHTKSCREAFSEENGYELYFVDADNDPQLQVETVRNFIREQVDYIVIAPILPTGWDAVLIEAYHAKIPVIIIDRTVTCDERYYTAWYGSDFVREGECAGAWLQKYLDRNGRGQETIRIAAINGITGTSTQIGRTEGFAKYLEKNPNWHLLDEQSGDFTEAGGRRVMEEYLEKFNDISVVICQNDNEALGACAALEEAGISYGQDGDVAVISFDAARAGLKAVLQGKINADFECSPLSPSYAERAVRKLEAGEYLTEKKHYLAEKCFAADEEPMILRIENGAKRMIPVTNELLKNRDY